ncbi:macrophage mannose receptor 1-like [Sparus aurata]|uniref:macrophage mannose receptor 1-like n=1 Tax=Sparus aurata TaxID=8175 RepID=UPI0011C13B14|nr:macrophage mannose receptor 1-like [Sparus aurata]
MDAVLLLVMAASGLSVVSSQVRRQYHFIKEMKTMHEAQKYCRAKYTDLATIDNMEDMNIVIDVAKKSKGVYIGLYDDVNSWRWSLSDTSFYKEGEAGFRQWKTGLPDNSNSLEHCALMYNGLWDDSDCKSRRKSVCMDVRGLNVTFVLIGTLMSWTEAQRYCRDRHTDLASVRNTAENQQVKGVVPPGEQAWIGLFRDSWKWSDGSTSSFRYWSVSDGQPNGGNLACVVATIGKAGKWFNDSCEYKLPFVCYSLH